MHTQGSRREGLCGFEKDYRAENSGSRQGSLPILYLSPFPSSQAAGPLVVGRAHEPLVGAPSPSCSALILSDLCLPLQRSHTVCTKNRQVSTMSSLADVIALTLGWLPPIRSLLALSRPSLPPSPLQAFGPDSLSLCLSPGLWSERILLELTGHLPRSQVCRNLDLAFTRLQQAVPAFRCCML